MISFLGHFSVCKIQNREIWHLIQWWVFIATTAVLTLWKSDNDQLIWLKGALAQVRLKYSIYLAHVEKLLYVWKIKSVWKHQKNVVFGLQLETESKNELIFTDSSVKIHKLVAITHYVYILEEQKVSVATFPLI